MGTEMWLLSQTFKLCLLLMFQDTRDSLFFGCDPGSFHSYSFIKDCREACWIYHCGWWMQELCCPSVAPFLIRFNFVVLANKLEWGTFKLPWTSYLSSSFHVWLNGPFPKNPYPFSPQIKKHYNLGLVSLCDLYVFFPHVLFLNPTGRNHPKSTRRAVTGCLVAITWQGYN